MRKWLFLVVALVFLSQRTGVGWGLTGHVVITRAAIGALPADVPGFVKRQIDWIGARSITPDSYRAASEPFIKMAEDPSHEWHLEQVAFLKTIPRSRVEFIQALYDEYKRLREIRPGESRARQSHVDRHAAVHDDGSVRAAESDVQDLARSAARQAGRRRSPSRMRPFTSAGSVTTSRTRHSRFIRAFITTAGVATTRRTSRVTARCTGDLKTTSSI